MTTYKCAICHEPSKRISGYIDHYSYCGALYECARVGCDGNRIAGVDVGDLKRGCDAVARLRGGVIRNDQK